MYKMYISYDSVDVSGGSDEDVLKSGPLACRAACKMLNYKDYIDLLWTTLAEFPGRTDYITCNLSN